MAIQVTLLGTGGPRPDVERAQSAVLVEVDGERYLVDCGDGVTRRLLEARVDPGSITTVLLTHLHVDHCLDVASFVYAGWFAGRSALHFFGPTGTRALVDDLLHRAHGPDAAARIATGRPAAGLQDVAVDEIQPGLVLETNACRISALPVRHNAPTETYALRFEDGAGGSIVISSDTGYCEALAGFAHNADLLVHECYVTGSTHQQESSAFHQMLATYHVTPEQAGTIGRLAGARSLVLTHFPYRLDESDVAARAQRAFGAPVGMGRDLMRLEV